MRWRNQSAGLLAIEFILLRKGSRVDMLPINDRGFGTEGSEYENAHTNLPKKRISNSINKNIRRINKKNHIQSHNPNITPPYVTAVDDILCYH